MKNIELENQTDNTYIFKLEDTFNQDQYSLYYRWAIENGYTIKEIESLNGKRYFQVVELPNESNLTYVQKRLKEYPSIGDQLDMIYWDKINGTNFWQEKITEIKNKYPKK